MKIEHLALWVRDLEATKSFYTTFFGFVSNEKYVNEKKHFASYFLSLPEGPRLELMQRVDILPQNKQYEYLGWAHIAISVGSRERVDSLTEEIRKAGYEVAGRPRTTGDGYYESVVLDPEGNRVEITI